MDELMALFREWFTRHPRFARRWTVLPSENPGSALFQEVALRSPMGYEFRVRMELLSTPLSREVDAARDKKEDSPPPGRGWGRFRGED